MSRPRLILLRNPVQAAIALAGTKWRGRIGPQNPNLAQIALLSIAEISSSGIPANPSSEASVPAPAELRPSRPDNKPLAGAITGGSDLSPYRARSVERRSPSASASPSDTEVSPAQYSRVNSTSLAALSRPPRV